MITSISTLKVNYWVREIVVDKNNEFLHIHNGIIASNAHPKFIASMQ